MSCIAFVKVEKTVCPCMSYACHDEFTHETVSDHDNTSAETFLPPI